MSATIISLENVKKTFGHNKVLDGVSFDVKKSEAVVLIGASGCGKSVTLKCLLGLLTPNQGAIAINNRSAIKITERERSAINDRIGMLFQSAALFDSLTVWENVAFRLLIRKEKNRKDIYQNALESLAKVGLGEDVAHQFPDALSGGMRKRVGLARAIITNPDILFFDEPTTGLDPITSDVINDLIVASSKELGATTLIITHDMPSLRKIADRVAMLHDGKIVWQGKKSEMDKTDNPYIQQFIHGRAEGPVTDPSLKLK